MHKFVSAPAVYRIVNTETGGIYIGSSSSVRSRVNHHFASLKRGVHSNIRLQESWNEFGSECFSVEILEYLTDASALLEREQHFIDFYQSFTGQHFNKSPSAGINLGLKMTAETKQKKSNALKGRPLSEAHKAALSSAMKGNTNTRGKHYHTSESRDNLSTKMRAIAKENGYVNRLRPSHDPLIQNPISEKPL